MVQRICRPIALLAALATTALGAGTTPAIAQDKVPRIARGAFDARMTVPGTRTVYHRRWRLSPSCLGAACATIRLRMQRTDGRFDAVTLRRDGQGVYRGRVRTRSVCRGRLAKQAGTISIAIRVTRTVRRNMLSGRETIITEVGGGLRIESRTGVCPRLRHMGKRVEVGADRVDLPEPLHADFQALPPGPSVSARTNTLQFSDVSSPQEVLTDWRWDFGDPASGSANRASERNATHTYAPPAPTR
jgi:hypothetical protein